MKYDFTSIINRQGKDAIAVEGIGFMPGFTPEAPKEGFDFIPMWVADMNFSTVPTIQEEMIKRAQHGLFGYFLPTEEYYASIIDWHEKRNGVTNLTKEDIGYENGVLGGLLSAMRVLCSQGDKVLIHTPTYVGFTMSLKNNGFDMIHSPLYRDEDGIWRMDYEDMEKKIIEHNIHATIFCSPHNPVGRVWEPEEIEKAMEIFERHNVFVISDEIWSDILLDGNKHIPTQSVNNYAREHTVALYAPSKTFNLAGLVGSYHIIYNKWLRDRVRKESSLSHYNEMNVLSMHALIGAYKAEGHEWLDELNTVLSENVQYVYDFVTSNFSGVTLSKPQGTYMLYLDCEEFCKRKDLTLEQLLKLGNDVGVGWQSGLLFNSPYSIRLNVALPLSKVKEAMDRLNEFVFVD
ncbi:aminotransferase class I/II-fold pyridoxal phosphate-dependent enzyme [Aerococcaceae bacterium zg-ZUI334]|uniref:MalY/PatB family protein n=1 Tax=Aerococcaceae bacterium zg-252 TaxID=2796928 RepID=UPI001B9080B1|nr:aminotransferase class I/II-fold pyridoxal phosphate-dependent enzyme [Aerococcaceae bacterium zg-ZUI334]